MKKLTSFLHKLVRWPNLVIGGLVISVLAFGTNPASASFASGFTAVLNGTGGSIIKSLCTFIFGLVGFFANLIANLFLLIINSVILPGQNSLFFGASGQVTVVKQTFDTMLGIANTLFFIALVVFAVMIITRQAGYNFKKAITALVVAIVIANLSYPLVQVLIELGDSLRNSGAHLFGNSMDATSLKAWFTSFVALAELQDDPTVSTTKVIFLGFALAAAQCIMAYVFFRLMAVLVERAIRLVALTIFAPIQAVMGILPQKELQFGGNWFSDVIRWILVLPVVFILIGIAQKIFPSPNPEDLRNLLLNVWPDEANTTNTPTISGFAFQLIIGLGLMGAAANVPALLKLPVSAATKLFMDSASGAAGMAGKALKTDATARLKDAGFKFTQKTAAGRWAYNKIAGGMAARRSLNESQVKQRELATKEAATNATSSRFLNMQRRYDNIKKQKLDAAAQAQKGKNYKTFEDWQNDYNLSDEEKAKRDKVEKGVKDGLDRTQLGIGKSALERDYMVALGKASQEDYEIGRTPEETKKLYDAAKKKWIESGGKNKTAAFDMQKYFDVLKKQALRIPGDLGKEAAGYRNDIAKNDEKDLRAAGQPEKFGYSEVHREDDKRSLTSQDYVNLAQRESDHAKAKQANENSTRDLRDPSSAYTDTVIGARGGADIDLDIKSADTQTINLVASQSAQSAETRDALTNISNVNLENIVNIAPKAAKEEIEKIQNRRDLSADDKQAQIEKILSTADPRLRDGSGSNANAKQDRENIAKALARNLKFADLNRARNLSRDLKQGGPLQNKIQAVITSMSELKVSETRAAEARTKVEEATPVRDSYKMNVSDFENKRAVDPSKTNKEWLKEETRVAKEELKKLMALLGDADLSIEAAIAKAAATPGFSTTLDPAKLAQMVEELELKGLKPGKDLADAKGFSRNMSLRETYEMTNNIDNANQ